MASATRRRVAVLAAATSLLGALATGCAMLGDSAERAHWDQERVTSYARELAAAAERVKDAIRTEPSILSLTQQRAHYQFREDVRLLENSAGRLVTELEAGKGYEETAPLFRRIRTLRRNAEENGRKAVIPEQTLAEVVRAGELLNRLAPYYPETSEDEAGP